MRSLKNASKRWVIPSALAAALVAALFISPALGGPGVVTGKKVVTTIEKKVNATQLTKGGVVTIGTGPTVVGTLDLPNGNYVVTATFDLTNPSPTAVAATSCNLSLGGVPGFAHLLTIPALSNAGETLQTGGLGTQAVVNCNTITGTAQASRLELTALKVPKVRVIRG
jgi:hypothetical protein